MGDAASIAGGERGVAVGVCTEFMGDAVAVLLLVLVLQLVLLLVLIVALGALGSACIILLPSSILLIKKASSHYRSIKSKAD